MSKKTHPKKYALLSVFDKTGIVELSRVLQEKKYKIISTGGTAKILSKNGIPVVPIQKITGNPESFDGRMKTISFQIESGILFDRTNKEHLREAKKLRIPHIDIVVCNLYPFEKNKTIENIDVGGPTMIRAAAKNNESVLVVTNPKDYGTVEKAIQNSLVSSAFKKRLAAKAFQHLSFYDSQIAKYLSSDLSPRELTVPGRRTEKLRYGENPHQNDSFLYIEPGTNSPLKNLQRHTGRELSYVNVIDIAAGLETVRMFREPAAVVIKHNSPCGIALGKSPEEALRRAVEADPLSAFGGIVVLNKPIDESTANVLARFKKQNVQMDIVAAPSLSKLAEEIIHRTRKTTGIYTFGTIPKKRSNPVHLKFLDGGFIAQPWDDDIEKSFKSWKCVTKIKPTKKQVEQMKIAWKFISRIRSNSIIVVDKNIPMTRGIGSGQTARVLATEIALKQAGRHTKNAILASDSFFPFPDSVTLAVGHGIAAIVQQGGSMNDQASIDTANKAKIPMILTYHRAFWH